MYIMNWYTDGSCLNNPGPGGYCAMLVDNNVILEGGLAYTTNNIMELQAVIVCLEYIHENFFNTTHTIHVDSMYVKNGITSWIYKWKSNGWKTTANKPVKNKEYWEQLDNICNIKNINDNMNEIKWVWVKAHSINPYNQMVDKIAREQAIKYTLKTV